MRLKKFAQVLSIIGSTCSMLLAISMFSTTIIPIRLLIAIVMILCFTTSLILYLIAQRVGS